MQCVNMVDTPGINGKLLDVLDLLADFFDGLVLLLVEDDLVLLEHIAAFGVDGNDQGTHFLNMAAPQSLGHAQLVPVVSVDLFHFGSSHNGAAGGEDTVDSLVGLAGVLGVFLHAALADDDLTPF